MGLLGLSLVVGAAIVAGVAVQAVTKTAIRLEWLIVSVAVVFGAYFASESFPGSNIFSGIKDWGPAIDGLVIVPAVIGALILGVVADIGMRSSPDIRPAQ